MAEPNCIEIVAPFSERLHDDHALAPVQLMGGIASAALQHEGTTISLKDRTIVTSPGFLEDPATQQALSAMRPNGTLRDMDALVLSSDPMQIAAVEATARQTIGDQLEISVFGLHTVGELYRQIEQPFGVSALKTFLSDRYVGGEGGLMYKALFPFAATLPEEALETYSLEVGKDVFPVANPAAAIMNYWTRSISGLRAKDADKVQQLAGEVFAKAPELVDWIVDGPGQSQMELAAILHTLRFSNSGQAKRELTLGGAPGIRLRAGSVRALAEHESFMLPNHGSNVQDAVLALAAIKSRGLGVPESNPLVVKLYQRHVERHMGAITKNQDI